MEGLEQQRRLACVASGCTLVCWAAWFWLVWRWLCCAQHLAGAVVCSLACLLRVLKVPGEGMCCLLPGLICASQASEIHALAQLNGAVQHCCVVGIPWGALWGGPWCQRDVSWCHWEQGIQVWQLSWSCEPAAATWPCSKAVCFWCGIIDPPLPFPLSCFR